MKKLLITLLLFVITAYSALAVCLTPTNNLMINATSDLCNTTTYYLNDTDSNGIILINSNNIQLNCLGAVIIGNRTGYGIKDYNFKRTNITLNGCSFSNYTRGIEWSTPNGSRILNSNFSGNGYNAYIYHNSKVACGVFPNFLINNTYFDNSYSSSSTSLYLENGANFELQNIKSRNNQGRGVYFSNSACGILNNSIVTNNSLGLSAGVNAWFSVGSDNALVTNNDFSHSNHNNADDSCLNAITNNSVYRNNTLNSCGHAGINLAQNYTVAYNIFDGNRLNDAVIYVNTGIFNNFTNNIVNNSGTNDLGENSSSIALSNDWNYPLRGNYIANNIFANSLSACIWDASTNNTYYNNTLINCTAGEVSVSNTYIDTTKVNYARFIDNNYPLGYARYVRNNNGAFNITINETSTANHTFQIPIQTGSSINLLFNYNGRKDLRLDNATPYINLNAPFNDVRNGSVLVASDVSSYSTIIQSGELWSIGDFLNSCTAPFNNTPLKDTSGNGNTLTNNGAVYNSTGGNYEYDGINDYMTTNYLLNLSTNYTISLDAYINPSNYTINHMLVFGSTSQNATGNNRLRFQVAGGILQYAPYNSSGNSQSNVVKSGLSNYTRNSVLLAHNSTSYLICVNAVCSIFADTLINKENVYFNLGLVAGSTIYFNGSIDNVMIFNRSLSSSEVLALYNGQYVDRNGLIAEYTFTNDTLWQIPMSQNCTINAPFNGTILLNGTGNVYLNSTINTSNIWLPRVGQSRWFMSNARLY